VERDDPAVITLFAPGRYEVGGAADIEGDPAHHARVRRAEAGDPVRLLDGRGSVARGTITVAGKSRLAVAIERVEHVPRPAVLEVVAPVADRDRMLLAAEKCAELQVTAWRPAWFARSRSVSPRGEGPRFREKVLARMQAALEQSGGAWLPEIHEELEAPAVFQAVAAVPTRLILDASGAPLPSQSLHGPVVVAVGPEGGFEAQELAGATATGWVAAAIGGTTLRFETAIISAAAVIRATQRSRGNQ
jgi:16S rRNA (uracil1498-N3)-methyltransferase